MSLPLAMIRSASSAIKPLFHVCEDRKSSGPLARSADHSLVVPSATPPQDLFHLDCLDVPDERGNLRTLPLLDRGGRLICPAVPVALNWHLSLAVSGNYGTPINTIDNFSKQKRRMPAWACRCRYPPSRPGARGHYHLQP
jgi:hypothetical protein